MFPTVRAFALDNSDAWENLTKEILPSGVQPTVDRLVSHVTELGAKSVIVEEEYLDRDYSTDYILFYARMFKRYLRYCKRLHFFLMDVSGILELPEAERRALDLERAGEEGYLGFVVVRPLSHAPIGRTLLRAPFSPADCTSHLLVRGKFEANLLGARLKIQSAPFIQQDTRVGACAQASIWVCARYAHAKHRLGWNSLAQITAFASNPVDAGLSRSLPAGSGGLNLDHMTRALRVMGYQPLPYLAENITEISSSVPPRWLDSLRPRDVINRYVDSGIPVILGLYVGEGVWHSVTVVGHNLYELPIDVLLPARPTRSVFVRSFLVHDDQSGCYLNMPVDKSTASDSRIPNKSEYNIEDNVIFIIAPLPDKVFLKAEIAEQWAWGVLSDVQKNWETLKPLYAASAPASVTSAETLLTNFSSGKVVTRTYLSFGSMYKRRLVRTNASNALKKITVLQALPRFVWITEIGTFESLNCLDQNKRLIHGHIVTDATSHQFAQCPLLVHLPGFLQVRNVNPGDQAAEFEAKVYLIDGDVAYEPRHRRT